MSFALCKYIFYDGKTQDLTPICTWVKIVKQGITFGGAMRRNRSIDIVWQSISTLFICIAIIGIQINYVFAADYKEKPVFEVGTPLKDAVEIAFPEFDVAYLNQLEKDDKLVFSSWPHCPACFVAAVLEEEGSESMILSVAVLQRDRNTVKQLAANEFKLDAFNWKNHIGLDLAPYRIRDKEFAFGVRISTSYRSDAHSSTWTTLHLFRLSGNKITRIFEKNVVGRSIEGGSNSRSKERSEDDGEEGKEDNNKDEVERFHNSTVHIDSLAPNGFYDLIVKTTKGEKSVKSKKVLQQERSIEKYRWSGTAYEKIK